MSVIEAKKELTEIEDAVNIGQWTNGKCLNKLRGEDIINKIQYTNRLKRKLTSDTKRIDLVIYKLQKYINTGLVNYQYERNDIGRRTS